MVPRNGECVSCPPIPLSPKGECDVENHGVDPDYAVEQDPKAVSEGHDPQLEKAVALALEELEKHPVKKVERPALFLPGPTWRSLRMSFAMQVLMLPSVVSLQARLGHKKSPPKENVASEALVLSKYRIGDQ